jgi:hypothetical protein
MKTRARLSSVAAVLVLGGVSLVSADTGGEGQIAFEGYYLAGNSNQLANITGIATSFRTFFPGFGIVTGNLESFDNQDRFRTGTNYIDLNGATWFGLRWHVTGGDFQVPAAPLPSPFTNVFLPELAGEGFKMEASSRTRRYSVFEGVETLQAGPRVPFRIRVPQKLLGAAVTDRITEKLEIGTRAIYLLTDPGSASSSLFAPGEDFHTAASLSSDISYKISPLLEFYADVTASRASALGISQSRETPLSFIAGPAWKSRKLTIKANYVRQTASYLPVAGYFLGDRSGPYAEAEFKPAEAIELFGSAGEDRNNLAHSADLSSFDSKSSSAGVSVALPYRFSVSSQLSTTDLSTEQPAPDGFSSSRNQQLVTTLGRPIRNHNLHFSYRDLKILATSGNERQRSAEIEDVVQFRKMSLGAAVREQQLSAQQSKDTLFFRGSAQLQGGRFSAYAYVERGQDLVNRTVFLTSAFSTTVLGGTVRLSKAANLQIEASQTRLTTSLNPENIFLLENQGAFVSNAFTGVNQWIVYFRLTRNFTWGHGLPAANLDKYAAEQLPIVGTIAGKVAQQDGARLPAAGIPVMLDDGRIATTDTSGLFRFSGVSEGHHRVSLDFNQLPAEYDPGATQEAAVEVRSRRTAFVELSVIPLLRLSGRIVSAEGAALDGVVVKLLPTARYTTPALDGTFAFSNLREGEYELAIDLEKLPEFAVLDKTIAHVSLKHGAEPEPPAFRLSIHRPEKPIHHAFAMQ